jgi:hypothetical protein
MQDSTVFISFLPSSKIDDMIHTLCNQRDRFLFMVFVLYPNMINPNLNMREKRTAGG